jgi:predicted nucleotidyltransferase
MMATQTDLDGIVACIVAREDPERIYLFGSYAKNTAHSGSDIDLLIIQPSRLPRHHRGRAAKAMLSPFPKRFHLLFYTPQELADELRHPFSFMSKIIQTAKLLFESTSRRFRQNSIP